MPLWMVREHPTLPVEAAAALSCCFVAVSVEGEDCSLDGCLKIQTLVLALACCRDPAMRSAYPGKYIYISTA